MCPHYFRVAGSCIRNPALISERGSIRIRILSLSNKDAAGDDDDIRDQRHCDVLVPRRCIPR